MNHPPSAISQKLTLIQLADSFFPSGAYTLSHGLESLVEQDKIQQPEDLSSFIQILLANKIATCDLVALIHAYRAATTEDLEQIKQVAVQLYVRTAIETTRKTQIQSGRALLTVAESTWQHSLLARLDRERALKRFYCLHPVVFGAVGYTANLGETDTALAFLHSFATGALSAAIRLGKLGHLKAQQILLELGPQIETAYQTASVMRIDEMWSCTPAIDLAQMLHGKSNQRLFAS